MHKFSITAVFSFFLVFILIFAAVVIAKNFTGKKHKYNVILISIDSLRADHMSLYGYGRKTTPNVDAWAKDAFVAKNYFSTAYLTPMSEASVHTGLYIHDHRVVNFESEISSKTPTIAEILKSKGYRTAAFGNSPEFRASVPMGQSFRRGYDVYHVEKDRNKILPPIDAIKDWTAGGGPFFLWIPVGAVHFPYGSVPDKFPDTSYSGIFKGDSLGYYTLGFIYKNNIFRNAEAILESSFMKTTPTYRVENTLKLNDYDKQHIVDKYDDGIYYVDSFLGSLFSYLDQSGLSKNTIVIIQSEHGEDLGEHETFMHYDIWDVNTRVPLVIKVPGMGSVSYEGLLSGVDILPTVLDVLDDGVGDDGDGVSFAGAIGGLSTPVRSEVFTSRVPLWERQGIVKAFLPMTFSLMADERKGIYQDFAIRTDRWKLIHRKAKGAVSRYSWYGFISGQKIETLDWELYNVSEDPFEKQNIFDRHKNEAEIIALQNKLRAFEQQAELRLKLVPRRETVQQYF